MNKLVILLLLVMITTNSCKKDPPLPCDILVDGVYQYPELPPDHNMQNWEVKNEYKIPEEILECISTEGFIETILNYPLIGLIWEDPSGPQSGYTFLRMSYGTGLAQLEVRPDLSYYMLRWYRKVDSSSLLNEPIFLYEFEVILCQYYELFKGKEKTKIIEKDIEVYEMKKQFGNIAPNFSGLTFTAAFMARIMNDQGFDPFREVYDPNDPDWKFVTDLNYTNMEVLDLVYVLSIEYLDYLMP